MIHIINDGSGDFATITAALESIPADNSSPVTLLYTMVYTKNG